MKLKNIHITNFRLLKDVDISLEEKATVIVGRNNSGKTSLTELFRRLLSENSPSFALADFNLSVHEDFLNAFILHTQDSEETTIRQALPLIEVELLFDYASDAMDLGPLADFVIDSDSGSDSVID